MKREREIRLSWLQGMLLLPVILLVFVIGVALTVVVGVPIAVLVTIFAALTGKMNLTLSY